MSDVMTAAPASEAALEAAGQQLFHEGLQHGWFPKSIDTWEALERDPIAKDEFLDVVARVLGAGRRPAVEPSEEVFLQKLRAYAVAYHMSFMNDAYKAEVLEGKHDDDPRFAKLEADLPNERARLLTDQQRLGGARDIHKIAEQLAAMPLGRPAQKPLIVFVDPDPRIASEQVRLSKGWPTAITETHTREELVALLFEARRAVGFYATNSMAWSGLSEEELAPNFILLEDKGRKALDMHGKLSRALKGEAEPEKAGG